MNECVNMLLYWMYVIRLNAPQRCAWQKTTTKKQQQTNKQQPSMLNLNLHPCVNKVSIPLSVFLCLFLSLSVCPSLSPTLFSVTEFPHPHPVSFLFRETSAWHEQLPSINHGLNVSPLELAKSVRVRVKVPTTSTARVV